MRPISFLAFVLALLASSPALANYQICMTHCMKQHADFDSCNGTCTETTARTNELSASPGASKCASYSENEKDKEKTSKILRWAEERYDVGAIVISPIDNKGNVFEVDFNLYDPPDHSDYCMFRITVDGSCRITDVEFVEGTTC